MRIDSFALGKIFTESHNAPCGYTQSELKSLQVLTKKHRPTKNPRGRSLLLGQIILKWRKMHQNQALNTRSTRYLRRLLG